MSKEVVVGMASGEGELLLEISEVPDVEDGTAEDGIAEGGETLLILRSGHGDFGPRVSLMVSDYFGDASIDLEGEAIAMVIKALTKRLDEKAPE